MCVCVCVCVRENTLNQTHSWHIHRNRLNEKEPIGKRIIIIIRINGEETPVQRLNVIKYLIFDRTSCWPPSQQYCYIVVQQHKRN